MVLKDSPDSRDWLVGGALPPELRAAAEAPLPPEESAPLRARFGQLGLCLACKHGVATHWDTSGRFIGCPAVGETTVFVLVPVHGATLDTGSAPPTAPAAAPPSPTRRFQRARYFPTKEARSAVKQGGLSDQRKRVLQAVLPAAQAGALAREIRDRSGLPHGSVQQALNWLQAHNLVDAKEDTTPITSESD